MKNKYIYIVIVLVLIGIVCFFKISNIKAKELEVEINQSINRANYCSLDLDCTATQLDQPFGCFRLINKDFDLIDIKNQIQKFNRNDFSRPANYNCLTTPNQEELKCESNKCIDIRQ